MPSGTDVVVLHADPVSNDSRRTTPARHNVRAGGNYVYEEALRQRVAARLDAIKATPHTPPHYAYVLGVINPRSGENAAAKVVQRGLIEELGASRVVLLDGAVFADPSGLRETIKRLAVRYVTDASTTTTASGPLEERGTVIVSGGDGTVAFILDQMDLVRRELREELRRPRQEPTSSTAPAYRLPAVAPIPLGTGNDFSNAVGFGSGYTRYKGFFGWLCPCVENEIAPLLEEAVSAPAIPFDRWEADFVPLKVAHANLHQMAEAGASRPREPNPANFVHHVDWERIRREGNCPHYGVMNYLGVGYDAYVVAQFDRTRRRHPVLCSTRSQNKAVYGVMAMKGGLRCKKIRKLIPMVCVPAVGEGGSGGLTTPAALSHAAGRSPEPCTEFSRGRRPMVALRLPSTSRAMVMTNVNCYSSGSHPWDVSASRSAAEAAALYYRPILVEQDRVVAARGVPVRLPPVTPVYINDGKFELQAMGGPLHYSSLGLGFTGAHKIAQVDELFVFVLCTPEDLCSTAAATVFTSTHLKRYEERLEEDAKVRASLNVQVDGEALPRLTEPTVIHLTRAGRTAEAGSDQCEEEDRVLVRCCNPKVVLHRSSRAGRK